MRKQVVILIMGLACFVATSFFVLAKPVQAQTSNGVLKVTSFPSGANVKIDGVDTGKTTPMSTTLTIGDHTVVVVIPNSGWNPDSRTVTIVAGNNDLSVTLLPMLTVGPQGPPGAAATVQVGTTTTLLPGSPASVVNSGTANAAVLNFLIPQGVPGPQGTKGDKGDTGATGATGAAGAPGAAATVQVGTTTTLPAGSFASVLNGGTQSAAVLNFLIPQGATGPTGSQGPPGPQGPAGVAAGFHGMREFTAPPGAPTMTYAWRAPDDVTHVMVEMWGAGGGGGTVFGGAGGAYSRGVIAVTPSTIYSVVVGGSGQGKVPFGAVQQDGGDSSVSLGDVKLIFAGGGHAPNFGELSEPLGGDTDSSAAISRTGNAGKLTFGSPAFGASFCPGPERDQTGRGGDLFGAGHPGYVVLTW